MDSSNALARTTATVQNETTLVNSHAVQNGDVQNEIRLIPLRHIRFFKGQPRKWFNPHELNELIESISLVGQHTPGVVRPLTPPDGDYLFELVAGERRLRACIKGNIATFKAEVDNTPMTEDEQYEKAVSSNFGRADQPPTEIAQIVGRLKKMGRTDAQIAKRLCMSEGRIRQFFSLLALDPAVFALMEPTVPEEKRLTVSAALELLPVPPEAQVELARRASESGLSLIHIKNLINKSLRASGISRRVRPDKEYKAFEGFILRTADQLDIILSTPNKTLLEILRAGKLQERMLVFDTIGTLCKEFPLLEEQIKTMTKAPDDVHFRALAEMMKRLSLLNHKFPELREKVQKILREKDAVT
jgi:ParB family chromosome partitioning protein